MESKNPTNVDVFKFLPMESRSLKEESCTLDMYCADYVLLKMLEEGLHTDITLLAKGGSVKAHRSVLASASPVFFAMFQHNMKEQLTSIVDIPDMTIDGLQLFLLLLYTTNEYKRTDLYGVGSMVVLASDAIDKHFAEVWGAIHKYQVVTRLKEDLWRALERNLTPDNCWDYLNGPLQARRTSYTCHKYILDHYEDVTKSKSFLKQMRYNP